MSVILDNEIIVRHIIICKDCDDFNSVFTNMNEWINHRIETGHNRISHACIVTTEIEEYLFIIYPSKKTK